MNLIRVIRRQQAASGVRLALPKAPPIPPKATLNSGS